MNYSQQSVLYNSFSFIIFQQVNPVNSGSGEGIFTMVDVNGIETNATNDRCLQEEVDHKFYLGFDFTSVNNTMFYDPEYYPHHDCKSNHLNNSSI